MYVLLYLTIFKIRTVIHSFTEHGFIPVSFHNPFDSLLFVMYQSLWLKVYSVPHLARGLIQVRVRTSGIEPGTGWLGGDLSPVTRLGPASVHVVPWAQLVLFSRELMSHSGSRGTPLALSCLIPYGNQINKTWWAGLPQRGRGGAVEVLCIFMLFSIRD